AGAFFHNAYFYNALLRRTNLSGANLRFSTWNSADLFQIKLRASTIQLAEFGHARLREADFRNAQIFNTDFTGADLTGADFTGARLEKVNFMNSHFDPKCFRAAFCSECSFDDRSGSFEMIKGQF
ncbi:MAG TPA: pentapeptide repeat-containing protein, partial [Nitrospirota bacterium]|nr:pentapeptide repeat-containing protein [Nitrospirota bacterium]